MNLQELSNIKVEQLLVDFGNYLLSKERTEKLVSKKNKRCVTDADIANFAQKKEREKLKKDLFAIVGDLDLDFTIALTEYCNEKVFNSNELRGKWLENRIMCMNKKKG